MAKVISLTNQERATVAYLLRAVKNDLTFDPDRKDYTDNGGILVMLDSEEYAALLRVCDKIQMFV